jgi:hypothetical protein
MFCNVVCARAWSLILTVVCVMVGEVINSNELEGVEKTG